MGVIRDSVTLVFLTGAAIAVCSIVVAVYASEYLDVYPKDTVDPGQSQTVYYAVFYIRVLAVLTTVTMSVYLAWTYADSRHRVTDKKHIKLTAASMARITNSGLASSENSRTHRKRFLYGLFAFFILWLPPGLVMCFQGWLYKYKKADNDKITLLSACSVDKKSKTCDRLYNAGIAALVEDLLLAGAIVVLIVGLMSKGVEPDVAREQLLKDREADRQARAAADQQLAGAQAHVAQLQQQQGAGRQQHEAAQQALAAANKKVAALEAAERDRRAAEEQTQAAIRQREAYNRNLADARRHRTHRHGHRTHRRRQPSPSFRSSSTSYYTEWSSSSGSGRGGPYMSGGAGGYQRRNRYSRGGDAYGRGRQYSPPPRASPRRRSPVYDRYAYRQRSSNYGDLSNPFGYPRPAFDTGYDPRFNGYGPGGYDGRQYRR